MNDNNIVVSSHPKSGTILISRVIERLTGKKSLNDIMADKEISGCADTVTVRFYPDDTCGMILEFRDNDKIIRKTETLSMDSSAFAGSQVKRIFTMFTTARLTGSSATVLPVILNIKYLLCVISEMFITHGRNLSVRERIMWTGWGF